MRHLVVCLLATCCTTSIGCVTSEGRHSTTHRAWARVAVKSDYHPASRLTALVPQSAANRPTPAQIDAMAVKTLCEWNVLSRNLDREFGGHLCWHQQRGLSASPPKMGSPDTVTPSVCAPNEVIVAQYHTHGRYGNEGASGPDAIEANRSTDFPYYVVTPSDRIYRYQGPTAGNSQAVIGSCQQ